MHRREKVLDRYDELMQLLVEDFQRSAREAHAALKAAGEPGLPSRDDFVASAVSAAVARMPTPQRIRERLALDYFTPAVVRPALLEEELAQGDRVRQQREHQMELLHLEHRLKSMLVWPRWSDRGWNVCASKSRRWRCRWNRYWRMIDRVSGTQVTSIPLSPYSGRYRTWPSHSPSRLYSTSSRISSMARPMGTSRPTSNTPGIDCPARTRS
jgi:hypothetical protein